MRLFLPDGKELGLNWAGRVGEWELLMDKRSKPSLVNDSGLLWYFENFANPFKRQDPLAQWRCVKDYPWICPFLKAGTHAPCISRFRRDQKLLAKIEMTDWERRQGFRPEALQLTLFYEGYWYNVRNGEQRWTNEARPYSPADLVCKHFAVASMEYLKRQMNYSPLKWRILPLDDDLHWVNDQQIRYSGRFSACVFDIWD